MYIRRKVFSVAYDENGEERLFSTTEFVNEDTYLEQREYAWRDEAGNIWNGYEGDKSQGLAKVLDEIGEGEKISKTRYGKKAPDFAASGTNRKVDAKIKKLTDKEVKALNKSQKAGQKAYKNMLKEAKKDPALKKKLETVKEYLQDRQDIRERARKGMISNKKAALIGAGALAAGTAVGIGGKYLHDRRQAKKAALKAED